MMGAGAAVDVTVAMVEGMAMREGKVTGVGVAAGAAATVVVAVQVAEVG